MSFLQVIGLVLVILFGFNLTLCLIHFHAMKTHNIYSHLHKRDWIEMGITLGVVIIGAILMNY